MRELISISPITPPPQKKKKKKKKAQTGSEWSNIFKKSSQEKYKQPPPSHKTPYLYTRCLQSESCLKQSTPRRSKLKTSELEISDWNPLLKVPVALDNTSSQTEPLHPYSTEKALLTACVPGSLQNRTYADAVRVRFLHWNARTHTLTHM